MQRFALYTSVQVVVRLASSAPTRAHQYQEQEQHCLIVQVLTQCLLAFLIAGMDHKTACLT